jgi:phosphate transport system substrate-binding protein
MNTMNPSFPSSGWHWLCQCLPGGYQRRESRRNTGKASATRTRPQALWIACGVALLCGCGSAGGDAAPGETARITLTGSSTIAPLMSEIGKRFEQRHPGARVDVQTGGTSRGIADARGGLADIGMVSRGLADDESDLDHFPIARDGVCVIVHAVNPIESLSDEQIVGIYTGRIRNWSEVGGPDAPITVVNKAEGRSTLEVFTDHFGIDTRSIRADVVVGDNEHGIKTVAGNPHAIGYVSIGTAEFDRDGGVPIKLLPVGGVAASVENIARGTFPITRTLNLVTPKHKNPPPRVQELIEFAQSPAVHDLVEELSFVPIR